MHKHRFRFDSLIIDRTGGNFNNFKYFPQVYGLYIKYLECFEDDFSQFRRNALNGMVDFVEKTSSHFYLVLNGDELCGFFALERFIGNYSAEVVTCFKREYWGNFTKSVGLEFEDFCFNVLGLKKLKALIYPQNSRVKGLLRFCGFKSEALLKRETVKNGIPQDIEIYSVYAEERQEKCS